MRVLSLFSKNHYLFEKYGFEFTDREVINRCGPCYEKVFHHDDIFSLWVSVSIEENKIYFYDEYDCGGMVLKDEEAVPEGLDYNSMEFVEWLDTEIAERLHI